MIIRGCLINNSISVCKKHLGNYYFCFNIKTIIMRKILVILFLTISSLSKAQLVKELTKTIELVMPKKSTDSMPGTRGGAVAWHPVQKKYYAAFAGNRQYPLAVFSETGKRLSDDKLTCMYDLRGLWYNPKLKKICGNGYDDIGWFSYSLDVKGIPVNSEVFAAGMNQPGYQSVGTFNAKANQVYFLDGQRIYVYNEQAMQEEDSTIKLYPGMAKKPVVDTEEQGEPALISEDYNYTVLLYTGIPKAEFGLLNTYKKQVELYNRKTGLLTQILKLPANLPTWGAFNFSYSNGTYWAFDQETRTWTGYK